MGIHSNSVQTMSMSRRSKKRRQRMKKPKATVAEAAAKIDPAGDLLAFLIDITVCCSFPGSGQTAAYEKIISEVETLSSEFDAKRSTCYLCAATVKNFEQAESQHD